MSKEEYIRLYEKFVVGKTSTEEEKLLFEHKDEFEFSDAGWNKNILGDEKEIRDSIFKRLKSTINASKANNIFFIRKLFIAAAFFLLIGIAVYFIIWFENNTRSANNYIVHYKPQEILPAANKAVLTLANGSKIVLDNLKNGTISKQGNTSITKTNGNISYKHPIEKTPEQLYNTLTTPRGGQYHLTLQDGTLVWLNAASSLRFPVNFSNNTREVELTGEAYFEVAHINNDGIKIPFIVHVKSPHKNMDVQVLGTHFNIMAYDDENVTATTLLEGSVKIINADNNVLLKPGEQAALKKNLATIAVEKVDVDNAVAWKNGKFLFDKADIPTVMRQLSRWYDVDVVYKGAVPKQQFWGGMERNLPLSNVLEILKESDLKFEVQGRTLIVSE